MNFFNVWALRAMAAIPHVARYLLSGLSTPPSGQKGAPPSSVHVYIREKLKGNNQRARSFRHFLTFSPFFTLGGRFGYFFFFFCSGSFPRRRGGGGRRFFIENPIVSALSHTFSHFSTLFHPFQKSLGVNEVLVRKIWLKPPPPKGPK